MCLNRDFHTRMPVREHFEVKKEEDTAACHILPCAIKYSGPVDGSKFEILDNDGSLRSYFRGRPLQGIKIDLGKHGYCGRVLHANERIDEELDTETHSTQLVQKGSGFNAVIVWDHGRIPLAGDPWGSKLDQLLEFSRALSAAEH